MAPVASFKTISVTGHGFSHLLVFMSCLRICAFQNCRAATPPCWISPLWLGFLCTHHCRSRHCSGLSQLCLEKLHLSQLYLSSQERDFLDGFFFFSELWVGAARFKRKFCFHEIKGVGSMEIIPWAPMEKLQSVLNPRGWQTPPTHTPNKPPLPNPHN